MQNYSFFKIPLLNTSYEQNTVRVLIKTKLLLCTAPAVYRDAREEEESNLDLRRTDALSAQLSQHDQLSQQRSNSRNPNEEEQSSISDGLELQNYKSI